MKYFISILIIFIFLAFGFSKLASNNTIVKLTPSVSHKLIIAKASAPTAPQTTAPVVQKDTVPAPTSVLPLISDWKNLSDEELHNGPLVLSKESKWLGDVVTIAENDPVKKPESLRELRSCAQNKELVPAVRASCIISYLDLEPNAELLKDFGQEDSQILELAEFLLD